MCDQTLTYDGQSRSCFAEEVKVKKYENFGSARSTSRSWFGEKKKKSRDWSIILSATYVTVRLKPVQDSFGSSTTPKGVASQKSTLHVL